MDRERVIRAVDSCFDYWLDKHVYLRQSELDHVRQFRADALILLKEQPEKKTTRFVLDGLGCKCAKCNKMICLPGIVPSIRELKDHEWMFCPYCGRKAEWE